VPHFLALGPIYFLSSALYFAGLMTAAIMRNERYHEFESGSTEPAEIVQAQHQVEGRAPAASLRTYPGRPPQ
jgi:hypothetical protein